MVVEAPVIAAAGLASYAIAGGVEISRRIDRRKNAKHGVTLCLLGPRKSGKTTLKNLLLGGKWLGGTLETHEFGPDQVTVQRKKLRVKLCIDVPGGNNYLGDWERAAERSDATLYLIDITKIDEPAYREFITATTRQVGEWFARFAEDDATVHKKLFVVATHMDEDTSYRKTSADEYHDTARERLKEVVNTMGGFGLVGFTCAVLPPGPKDEVKDSLIRITHLIREYLNLIEAGRDA